MIEDQPVSAAEDNPDETVVIVAGGLRIVMRGLGTARVLRAEEGERSPGSTIEIEAHSDSTAIHLGSAPSPAAAPPAPGLVGAGLTPRQLEVLRLLAEGVRVPAIAARLGLSATTVRNHIRATLTRLGCHSQLEAVAEARRRRLLDG